MGTDRLTETFQDNFAEVFELESFADAQLSNRIRYQDLFRLRVGAEPGGELNCRTEEIVILLDRFAGRRADSNLDRTLRIRFVVPG